MYENVCGAIDVVFELRRSQLLGRRDIRDLCNRPVSDVHYSFPFMRTQTKRPFGPAISQCCPSHSARAEPFSSCEKDNSTSSSVGWPKSIRVVRQSITSYIDTVTILVFLWPPGFGPICNDEKHDEKSYHYH